MPIGRARTSVTSQITVDQDLPMAGYKLTGLGAGSASGNSLRYQQAILQAILTTAGDILYRGASVAARLAKGTEGHFLRQGATNPAWAEDVITALLTTRGDLLYEGASSVARLGKGTDGQFLKIGANDPEWATLTSPLAVAETEVFNGTSPTSWTDLDLNATIGAQATLVILKIIGPSTARNVSFRKNGDTDEFYIAGTTYSSHIAHCDPYDGAHFVCLVFTDTAGKIEWITEAAVTMVIDVMGYVK